MANQRPIRRGRIPVPRRTIRRPKRWGASTSFVDESLGLQVGVIPNETVNEGVPPFDQLLSGEFDVEPWADEQEIRLDRIVGDISIAGSMVSGFEPPIYAIRLGIIVAEDTSDDPAAADPTRSLFDTTDLQEAEWMWLHQVVPTAVYLPDATPNPAFYLTYNLHLDLRNRRKIGQKDSLFLYAAYSNDSNVPISLWNVRLVHNLRMIMVSK